MPWSRSTGASCRPAGRAAPYFGFTPSCLCVTVASFVIGLAWGIIGVAACYAVAKWVLYLPDTWITTRGVSFGFWPAVRASAGAAPACGGGSRGGCSVSARRSVAADIRPLRADPARGWNDGRRVPRTRAADRPVARCGSTAPRCCPRKGPTAACRRRTPVARAPSARCPETGLDRPPCRNGPVSLAWRRTRWRCGARPRPLIRANDPRQQVLITGAGGLDRRDRP